MSFKSYLIGLVIGISSCGLLQDNQLAEEKKILQSTLPSLITESIDFAQSHRKKGKLLLFEEADSSAGEFIINYKLSHCKEQLQSFLSYKSLVRDVRTKDYEWKLDDLDFVSNEHLATYDPVIHNEMKDSVIGIFGVSRIYFDQENNKGVMHYGFACDQYCAYDVLYFLELVDEQWEIVDQCGFGIP